MQEDPSPSRELASSPFRIGEIVALRSGSPPLEIVRLEGELVRVEYFDDAGERLGATFHFAMLEHAPAAEAAG